VKSGCGHFCQSEHIGGAICEAAIGCSERHCKRPRNAAPEVCKLTLASQRADRGWPASLCGGRCGLRWVRGCHGLRGVLAATRPAEYGRRWRTPLPAGRHDGRLDGPGRAGVGASRTIGVEWSACPDLDSRRKGRSASSNGLAGPAVASLPCAAWPTPSRSPSRTAVISLRSRRQRPRMRTACIDNRSSGPPKAPSQYFTRTPIMRGLSRRRTSASRQSDRCSLQVDPPWGASTPPPRCNLQP
jgi:hypothetical protein